ncbi:hypothetical protein AB0G19_23380 [Streptomyces althioticus]|uniref:hypothetical protein n=1 Tax=Streptomyces althioticus group TaxID=2867194 RepID=UPI0034090011|nr:hypothetical protein OHA53_12910 [Streptomyces althioticus]
MAATTAAFWNLRITSPFFDWRGPDGPASDGRQTRTTLAEIDSETPNGALKRKIRFMPLSPAQKIRPPNP